MRVIVLSSIVVIARLLLAARDARAIAASAALDAGLCTVLHRTQRAMLVFALSSIVVIPRRLLSARDAGHRCVSRHCSRLHRALLSRHVAAVAETSYGLGDVQGRLQITISCHFI